MKKETYFKCRYCEAIHTPVEWNRATIKNFGVGAYKLTNDFEVETARNDKDAMYEYTCPSCGKDNPNDSFTKETFVRLKTPNYRTLIGHVGHNLTCFLYGETNLVIECSDCNKILLEFEDLQIASQYMDD